MRVIGILTTGRQDWGILRSTARWLAASPDFDVVIFAGGMACSDEHGRIASAIAAEGLVVAEEMPWVGGGRTAGDEAGEAVAAVSRALAIHPVEALLVVGDRYETLAAGLAATLSLVPIVHLHGGEESEGAIDNSFRHALSKLAHLHLVSHPLHARRLALLGEHPDTVHVVGAPGLDNLHRPDLASREELEAHLGLPLRERVVVVTLQPTTLAADPKADLRALLGAMDAVDATYIVTLPNSDPGGDVLREALERACARPSRVAVSALGERRYWGLLRLAAAVLGNSSSALIEAPALLLPAVDIGDRQKGRLRGATVLSVPAESGDVQKALEKALDPRFRASLSAEDALFGDGRSAPRIGDILRHTRFPRPPVKPGVPVP